MKSEQLFRYCFCNGILNINLNCWAGRLTAKCDVYSFGVVLLELLSGRRAVDKTRVGAEQNLVDWAKPYLGDRRKLFRIMDIKLEGQYPQKGAYMVAILALQCISEAKVRPSMSEVLSALEQLPPPRDPASPSNSDPQVIYSPHVKSPMRPNSPHLKSHLRNNYDSPVNMSPRSPLPPHMKSPILKSPRGRCFSSQLVTSV